jgi:hypothetical protein
MTKTIGNIRLIGTVIVVGIFVFIMISSSTEKGIQLSAMSYSSAFEGPKAQFLGVSYNGQNYNTFNTYGASSHTFDNTMIWDPDGASSGKPKIQGEMSAIILPEDSLSQGAIPSSILSLFPTNWLHNNGLISQDSNLGMLGPGGVNPPWTWNISGNAYVMKEFDMRYYVSLRSTWSGSEDPGPRVSQPFPGLYDGYAYNLFTTPVSVWIHFDISPTWYIQGGGSGYFAIAELTLAEDAKMNAKDNNGVAYDARTGEQVNPPSASSVISLYYSAFGASTVPQGVNQVQYQYEGQNLNPAYFTSDLYAHVDLTNFGTWAGADYTKTYTRGDVVTFAFDMKVFVFGEYKVQDIQKNPSQFTYTVPIQNNGNDLITNMFHWLSNPANIALLTGVIILILVIIFAPWVLVAIIALLK